MQIIDHILGHLSVQDSQGLQQHLSTCPDCQRRYAEWQMHLQEVPSAMPSPRVYRRLRRRVQLHHLRRKWFRPAFAKASLAAASAAVLLFAMVSVFHGQTPTAPFSPAKESTQLRPYPPHAMILDARTFTLPIMSQDARDMGMYGNVWVNGHTDEMFFRVQGLIIDQEHDYQAWFIKSVNRENAGLLRMAGDYAELYTQGQNIREVKFITISKEPKGGSVSPTAPEVILFDLSTGFGEKGIVQ